MRRTLTTKMARTRAPILLISGLALAGCQDGEFRMPNFLNGGNASAPTQTVAGAVTEERDVEAPDVFSVTDQGLWDGRPSLGGVWVAHPDVPEPERVIIRNETTGAFVIGALFRRERENPGPVLQVSSDAAEELGMLADSPTTISVVALRREAAPVAPPIADADPGFDTAETVDPAAPAQVTAAPLDPVDDTIAAPSGDTAATGAPLGAPLDASVDPLAGAAAAIAAAEANAAATPAPAPAPVSSLSRPFIQIGIFSVETNANRAATQLINAGLDANVLAQNSQGRAFWRVIVGPALTEGARAAALNEAKGLGFTDAYFVTD